MADLHKIFSKLEQDAYETFFAETARVATTAESEDDDVYVVLPNSDEPTKRIPAPVKWRPGVKFVDGEAQPRYPQRGDIGAIIPTDTGEAWLIW